MFTSPTRGIYCTYFTECCVTLSQARRADADELIQYLGLSTIVLGQNPVTNSNGRHQHYRTAYIKLHIMCV